MKLAKYNRMILHFEIFVFILGIINVAWAIAKAVIAKWHPLAFSMTSLTIYVMFLAGLFLIQFALRDLIRYWKHKEIEHGFDERTTRILGNSFGNAAAVFIAIVYAAILYYELFYEPATPVISTRLLSFAFVPGMLVFLASWLHYSRSKGL